MEPAVESARATVETPQQHRILVVDDDIGQTEVLAYSLRKQGYQVTVAHSAAACFQAVRSDDPDLIVLDIELPSMCGLEICRQLKDSRQTCEIPIVLLSGTQRADVIREGPRRRLPVLSRETLRSQLVADARPDRTARVVGLVVFPQRVW